LNTRETGNLSTLEVGDSLLKSILKTKSKNGLIQIRLCELVKVDPDKSGNLKQLFTSMTVEYELKPRHAFELIGPTELEYFFGISFKEKDDWYINDREREELDLNILNPTFIQGYNKGKRLRVQIIESIYPKDEWQAEHWETKHKTKGTGGDSMLCNGKHIFSNTFVVVNEPKHVWLQPDRIFTGSGTFSPTKGSMEMIKPEGIVLPKEGTFEDLRTLLNLE
jgi:hypothetical protein